MLRMKTHLLIVSQLAKFEKYVMFGLADVKIYDKLKVIGSLVLEKRHMDFVYVKFIETTYIDNTQQNYTTNLWHAHLKHVGYNRLKVIMKKQVLNSLPQLDE